eukprot:scaffold32644_cov55-Attheya_sp.AAC.2
MSLTTKESEAVSSDSSDSTFYEADSVHDDDVSSTIEVALVELLDRQALITNVPEMPVVLEDTSLPADTHAYPCRFTQSPLPPLPSRWPQAPLLLRPTPHSHTAIRGIRHADSTGYQALPGLCEGCTLPINSGKEKHGKQLVIDFETSLFVGTVMLRIQNAKFFSPSDPQNDDEENNYFEGKKRTFQSVIQGRFKSPNVLMSRCVTGQAFDRPARKLPARWILSGAVKLMSRLAPQLQVQLHNTNQPRFLSPLLSTAQTVLLHTDIKSSPATHDGAINEPSPIESTSLIQVLQPNTQKTPIKSITDRRKKRKKASDSLFVQQDSKLCFDTSTVYTFEFYQHLLLMDEMALNLGKALGGKHSLAPMLNGQPLKLMAGVLKAQEGNGPDGKSDEDIDWLWSFDIWHSNLYPNSSDN